MYCGRRITPCESWPRRLAPTRLVATITASSRDTPTAPSRSAANSVKSVAVVVGTGHLPFRRVRFRVLSSYSTAVLSSPTPPQSSAHDIFPKFLAGEEMEPKTGWMIRVSRGKSSSFGRGVPSMMTEVGIGSSFPGGSDGCADGGRPVTSSGRAQRIAIDLNRGLAHGADQGGRTRRPARGCGSTCCGGPPGSTSRWPIRRAPSPRSSGDAWMARGGPRRMNS